MPIDNTNFGTNPGNAASDNSGGVRGGGNTSDGSDGLSSINLDDIESMTVKGATAVALSKPTATADVLYGGNIAQWKKFGNSLFLRAGMRLTKVRSCTGTTNCCQSISGRRDRCQCR